MWALEAPDATVHFDGALVSRGSILVLGGGLALATALGGAGYLVPEDLRTLLAVLLHGSLLTVALGAAAAASGGRWRAAGPTAITLALIVVSALATRLDARGAILYLLVLFWLGWLSARARLAPIGIRGTSTRAVLLGALAGLGLGSHVLLSAAFTLGYGVRSDGLAAWGLALAYDAGLNVASAELLVRGVLFDRLQRETSFATGAAISTVAYVARFLPDPRLPAALEVQAGAALYLTLLSVLNSWLFWWSGSLLPVLASALSFFAVYRLLGLG